MGKYTHLPRFLPSIEQIPGSVRSKAHEAVVFEAGGRI